MQRTGHSRRRYIWIDADPGDRPIKVETGNQEYKLSRLMAGQVLCRNAEGNARDVFLSIRSLLRKYRRTETRKDGLAKNPRTNYQACSGMAVIRAVQGHGLVNAYD